MKAAIDKIQELHDHEKDSATKAELRRALDTLKRSQDATEGDERPDYRDPNFKQVANQPESGEELANAKARRNREEGPLPETVQPPKGSGKTPPPVET